MIFSNISSHQFVMEEPIKDVSLDVIFQRMHKNDFNDAKHHKSKQQDHEEFRGDFQ